MIPRYRYKIEIKIQILMGRIKLETPIEIQSSNVKDEVITKLYIQKLYVYYVNDGYSILYLETLGEQNVEGIE